MGTVFHGVSVALDEIDGVGQKAKEIQIAVNGASDSGDAGVLGLGHGVKDLILFIVSRVLVVLAMGNTPGMKRDEDERMKNVAKE